VSLDRLVTKRSQNLRVGGDTSAKHDFIKLFVILADLAGRGSLNPHTVGNHFPVFFSYDAGLVGCLEIGLVEAREHNVAVVWLQLGVDILGAVLFILEVLETLAVSDEEGLKLDDDLVLANNLVVERNVDAMVLPQVGSLGSELGTIDDDRFDFLALVVNKEAF